MADQFSGVPVFSYANSDHVHDEDPNTPPAAPGSSQQPPPAPLGTAAAGSPAAAPPSEPQGQLDENGLSPEVKALREERAQTMFGQQAQHAYRHAIPDADDPKVDAEWREIMADVNASEPEARELYATYKRDFLEAGGPADDARFSQWERESQDWLNRTYGAQAKDALDAAMKLVARDPRVQHWLQVTRLGSHPSIVKFAVSKAYRR